MGHCTAMQATLGNTGYQTVQILPSGFLCSLYHVSTRLSVTTISDPYCSYSILYCFHRAQCWLFLKLLTLIKLLDPIVSRDPMLIELMDTVKKRLDQMEEQEEDIGDSEEDEDNTDDSEDSDASDDDEESEDANETDEGEHADVSDN